jgi:purine-cytosine permease-like protein
MDILVAFIIGSVAGCLVMAFVNGCANTNKINEAYMEGYLAGKRGE